VRLVGVPETWDAETPEKHDKQQEGAKHGK
jgi:hypothetical protein